MNDEHVIPKSLGGFRSTVIRSSAALNSRFATEIDARIADDPLIIFGRRDANARGHSRKKPLPRWRGAKAWKPGEPFAPGVGPYAINIPGSGETKVWDGRARAYLPPSVFQDTSFIVHDLKIDHVARLKFTVKTLLGVGWKLFGGDLIKAVDVDDLRSLLTADFQLVPVENGGRIWFTDPIIAAQDDADGVVLKNVERELVRPGITTVLIREFDGTLEWSLACVGHVVGVMRIKTLAPLIQGDVHPRGGIRLEIRRDGIRPILVDHELR